MKRNEVWCPEKHAWVEEGKEDDIGLGTAVLLTMLILGMFIGAFFASSHP